MPSIEKLLRNNKEIRSVGFDDSFFQKEHGSKVGVSGIVCSNASLEGMLYGYIEKDGDDATDVLAEMLLTSKFYEYVQVVLLDGLTMGGFNVIDLPKLQEKTNKPCVAVMRKKPDMEAIRIALNKVGNVDQRFKILEKAGEFYENDRLVFQVSGEVPDHVEKLLDRLCVKGNVPEPLRLAHVIGSAIQLGESRGRA